MFNLMTAQTFERSIRETLYTSSSWTAVVETKMQVSRAITKIVTCCTQSSFWCQLPLQNRKSLEILKSTLFTKGLIQVGLDNAWWNLIPGVRFLDRRLFIFWFLSKLCFSEMNIDDELNPYIDNYYNVKTDIEHSYMLRKSNIF